MAIGRIHRLKYAEDPNPINSPVKPPNGLAAKTEYNNVAKTLDENLPSNGVEALYEVKAEKSKFYGKIASFFSGIFDRVIHPNEKGQEERESNENAKLDDGKNLNDERDLDF